MRRFTHTFPQRISAFLLCLALCLGLLPVTALAAAPDRQVIYVGNTNVTSGGYWATDSEGKVTSAGTTQPSNNYIHYDESTNTLTLHNATIKESLVYNDSIQGGTLINGSAIGVFNESGNAELTITLEGTNTIADVSGGISVLAHSRSTGAASLTITGSGSLTTEGSGSGSLSGILVQSNAGNANLTINNVDVTATNSNTQGIRLQSADSSSATLTVNGGELTASGKDAGIDYVCGNDLIGSGTPRLTVCGNTIVKASGDTGGIRNNSSTDIQIGVGDNSSGGIVFDGSEGTVYGDVELQEDLTIESGQTLDIPSGASLNTGDYTLTVDGGTLTGNVTGKVTYKVTGVSLSNDSLTLDVGDTETLTPTITPDNATNKNVTWSSDNESVASVNDGVVTAVAPGTANITVTTEDGQYKAVCAVTVTQPVTGVSLTPASLSLFTGDTASLTATVQPENATNKTVNWESSNPDVATVEDGTVTAKGAGEATITVKTVDGGYTATCAVTVEKPYTPPPYIPPSKPNWTSVARKLANAQPGDTVTVKMNGETEVPGEVWETIAGRDVTVVLDMGGNVSWTVNGNDVPTATHFADMDFGVDRNTTGIDVDVINAITGQVSSVQITLAHDGEFGFTLTLTAPLGKENAGYWANLYHYDEDAEALNYETSAQVASDGTASLRMTHASQYAIVIDEKSHELPFTDLGEGQWYESAVRYAYLHDIMEGMSATTFQPNGTLSRAMAVQIFYNLEGQPDLSGENLGYPYEDVDAQAWYGDAVYWARLTGVATGYGDGTFQPGDSITRQEFAQMLYNYAKYKGYDLTAEGDLSQFPDSGSVADWAEAAMSWANGNQLINGHDDGTLEPGGTTTRAQAASILMRFDQNVVEN